MSFDSRIPSKAVCAELKTLLRVLEERDLPFGADDVAWAFESPKTKDSASSWVQKFLQPSTLLTKDELAFHEKRVHLGGIETSQSGAVAAAGRPLSDAEIEVAIGSLEASTAAIEKQTRVLEAQKAALKDLQKRNAASDATVTAKDARQNRLARERAQIDLDIDQLSHAASGRLRTAVKQSDAATAAISSQLDRLLVKDDRLLDGLRKLLPRISDSSLDRDEAADVEQLCSALAVLSVKEIHARLDKVYREAVADYSRRKGSSETELSDAQSKQRDNARAELKELGGEIDGLVGIVVDHQHRKPLQKGLLSARAESQLQRAQWSEYAVTALLYLTSRLDAIGDHVQHLRAHGKALTAISRAMDDATSATQVSRPGRSTSSPIADKSSVKGLKPLRLVQANRSDTQDPAFQFLRQHDIRVLENTSPTKFSEVLQSALSERQQRLATLTNRTEKTITDTITQSLANTDAELQILLESVFAYSEYGTVQLVDGEVQTGLETLEQGTQKVGDEMRELDVDAIANAVKGKQRDVLRKLGV